MWSTPNGNTIYSTDPIVKPINITDREYFSVPAAGQLWYTSSLLVSRLNGDQIFVFSKRLVRGGKFAGVAIVSFNVALFSEIWASLGLDKESTVSIIRDDGQLVARYPLADGPLDLSKYVLFTDYLPKSPSGVYSAISPADGVARFVGYRKVAGTELVALASISTATAYQLFWPNTLVAARPLGADGDRAGVRVLVDRAAGQERLSAAGRACQRTGAQQAAVPGHPPPREKQSAVGAVADPHAEHPVGNQVRPAGPHRRDDRRARTHVPAGSVSEIEAHELIPSIIAPLQSAFGANHDFVTDIEPLAVDRDFATPLALLVNEVVTNALKYAYPDGKTGTIRISLHKRGAPNGRSSSSPTTGSASIPDEVVSGMGNRLIKGMVLQLEGTSSYARDGGTTFTADIRVVSAMPAGMELKDTLR